MDTKHEENKGFFYAISAEAIWSLFPVYFLLFASSNSFEIVAHHALWSWVFCLILLCFSRGYQKLFKVLNLRNLLTLSVAGLLITINWTIYLYGVLSGRTIDAAMGYFITPLMVAFLGVVVLGEKLHLAQWIAFIFGIASVVVLVVAYGQFPYIALGISLSFGTYSLLKKLAGVRLSAIQGFTIETTAILPLAVSFIIYLWITGHNTVHIFTWYFAATTTTGLMSAIPLLLFAASAKRIPLIAMGILQYICPTIQFLIGWLVFGEPMPASRWIGFTLVWLAISIFITDIFYRRSKQIPSAK